MFLNRTKLRFVTFVVARNTPDQGTTQPTRTNGIRRPVYGHGRVCFVRRLWATGAYPKTPQGAGKQARCGLKKIEKQESQLKEKNGNNLGISVQAGEMACQIKILRTGLGRRWMGLEVLQAGPGIGIE